MDRAVTPTHCVVPPVSCRLTEASKRHRARPPGRVLIAPRKFGSVPGIHEGFAHTVNSTVNSNAMGVPGQRT